MWLRRFVLMWLIIAASDVDLPEPVGPVTRIRPRGRSESFFVTCGTPRSSIVLTLNGMTRNTAPMLPRCQNMLTRNRDRPGTM